jgi:diaminohydroxyphosphoribosylaminopyrimidine deaminase / 5-amino-6-(5-phosphoribosylamino)uracil reductase
MSEKDSYYMNIALNEAKKGLGFTSPNPMVGAVIVKNGMILSTGYHKKIGDSHAEVDAINKLTKDQLKDSILYVTLEPCCHYGRTPPCTDIIINSGIKKVVIGSLDVDERVCGKSCNILHDAGIEIDSGILENEARELNSIFYYFKKNKKPYVVLKAALTLDGKIATYMNDSKWISSENCRFIVQMLRRRLKSIAIGKNTILNDKPELNCRIKGFEKKPIDRLIFSRFDKNILEHLKNNFGKNYLIDENISNSKENFLEFCYRNEIDSILVEGGSHVYTWFLENDLVDRIYLFYKPAFLGKDGIPVFNGEKNNFIKDLKEFSVIKTEIIDNNILIEMAKGQLLCLLE